MMTREDQLARHVAAPHSIEPALVHDVRRFLLDYFGVTVGGIDRDSAVVARSAVTLVTEPDARRSARIHGLALWAAPDDAALINGITAHGLELDDTHEQASMHPAVVIFPAMFAYLDANPGLDFAAFVRAAVVGYDVMTSVGVLAGAAESYGRGFHPTGICGTLGAAAAVAALMGLDEQQAGNALALAANMSAGSLEFLSDGSWTKRLNAGHAAATGLRAATLARAGFEGPATYLGGRDGFLRQYGQGAVAGRELELELGRGIRDTSIKLYPCCRYMHGNIDLLRDIKAENPTLVAADIAAIECAVIGAGASLVSEPPLRKLNVTSAVDAQFNMPFGAAVAITTGQATVSQFDNAVEVAEELADLIGKVSCVRNPRVERAFPAIWQAAVTVTLVDGTEIARYTEAFKGSPGDPASLRDIAVKAAGLIAGNVVADLLTRLEALGDGTLITSAGLLGEDQL